MYYCETPFSGHRNILAPVLDCHINNSRLLIWTQTKIWICCTCKKLMSQGDQIFNSWQTHLCIILQDINNLDECSALCHCFFKYYKRTNPHHDKRKQWFGQVYSTRHGSSTEAKSQIKILLSSVTFRLTSSHSLFNLQRRVHCLHVVITAVMTILWSRWYSKNK